MIFVDANVPMYLVGAEHPRKQEAISWLSRLLSVGERLCTDAEVPQEILHRYVATGRPHLLQPALDALLGAVHEVTPITQADVLAARDIVLGHPRLSARDALHLAVMRQHRVRRILSFDRDFDGFPGVERLGS